MEIFEEVLHRPYKNNEGLSFSIGKFECQKTLKLYAKVFLLLINVVQTHF